MSCCLSAAAAADACCLSRWVLLLLRLCDYSLLILLHWLLWLDYSDLITVTTVTTLIKVTWLQWLHWLQWLDYSDLTTVTTLAIDWLQWLDYTDYTDYAWLRYSNSFRDAIFPCCGRSKNCFKVFRYKARVQTVCMLETHQRQTQNNRSKKVFMSGATYVSCAICTFESVWTQ